MGKVIAGNYEGWEINISLGSVIISKGFKTVVLNKDILKSIEQLTEENKKKFIGSAGAAALGGLVLGPIGLIAGVLAGGNKKEITFVCELTEDRKFMAVADSKLYTKLKTIMF